MTTNILTITTAITLTHINLSQFLTQIQKTCSKGTFFYCTKLSKLSYTFFKMTRKQQTPQQIQFTKQIIILFTVLLSLAIIYYLTFANSLNSAFFWTHFRLNFSLKYYQNAWQNISLTALKKQQLALLFHKFMRT